MAKSFSNQGNDIKINKITPVSNDEGIRLINPTENGHNVMEVDLTNEEDKSKSAAGNVSSPLRGTIKLRSIASLCDAKAPEKTASSSCPGKSVQKIAPKEGPSHPVGEIVTVENTNGIIGSRNSDLAKFVYSDVFLKKSKKAKQFVFPRYVMNPYQYEREIGDTIVGLNIFRSVADMKNLCLMCSMKKTCQCVVVDVGEDKKRSYQFLCSILCCNEFEKALNRQAAGPKVPKRKCANHMKVISKNEVGLQLQKKDFCSKSCITEYVKNLEVVCFQCRMPVKEDAALKYTTSFGSRTRPFCSYSCLQKFTESNKFCQLCHELNDVTDSQRKTNVEMGFCGWRCVRRKNQIDNGQLNYKLKNHCHICQKFDVNLFKFEAQTGNVVQPTLLCSHQCVAVFAYLKRLELVHCGLCSMMVDLLRPHAQLYRDGKLKIFCSDSCFSIYIIGTRKMVKCAECLVAKYDYDMISIPDAITKNMFCSLGCLNVNSSNTNGVNPTEVPSAPLHTGVDKCALCSKEQLVQCYMVMSDSSMRSFCSYGCATDYKNKFGFFVEPQKIEEPIVIENSFTASAKEEPDCAKMAEKLKDSLSIFKPKELCNKSVSCNLQDSSQEMENTNAETTNSNHVCKPVYIPVPVPIFVPTPMMMYSANVPVPLTIPFPVPFPLILPTTEKTGEDVAKRIKELLNSTKPSENDADSSGSSKETSLKASEISTNTKPNEENSNSSSEVTSIESPKDERLKQAEIDKREASSTAKPVESPPKDMQTSSQNKRKLSVSDDENEEPNKRPKSDDVTDRANNMLQSSHVLDLWNKWVEHKNKELKERSSTSKTLPTTLSEIPSKILNHSLCIFMVELPVIEKRKFTVEEIFTILLDIQRILCEKNYNHNIFFGDDFKKLNAKVDSLVSENCKQNHVKAMNVDTGVSAKMLLDAKLLGTGSPKALLMSTVYFATQVFKLSTVEQHLKLEKSTVLEWCEDPENNSPNTDDDGWNPLSVFKLYLSKCSMASKEVEVKFYLKPKQDSLSSPIWFDTDPISSDDLAIMHRRLLLVKEIRQVTV